MQALLSPKALRLQVFWLIGRILSKINCKTQIKLSVRIEVIVCSSISVSTHIRISFIICPSQSQKTGIPSLRFFSK